MVRYLILLLVLSISLNSSSAYYPIPLPGTSGNVLTSNGSKWVSQTNGASKDQSYEISNLTLTASVATSALTIAVKDKAGSDPSSGSPALIGMRSSTLTSGVYNQRSITGALSLVVSSGSTLGQTSGAPAALYVYLIDNAGTLELAVSQSLFDEKNLVSTTAEGGAGAADSALIMYSTTARTSVPFRLVGRITNTQATAGTWATAPSQLQVGSYAALATDKVAARYTTNAGQSIPNAAVTIVDFEDASINTHGNVTTGASWKFTAQTSGVYKVKASVMFDAAAFSVDDKVSISLYANGGEYSNLFYHEVPVTLTTYVRLVGHDEVQLNAGDYIDIRAYHNSGSAKVLINSSIYNYISITKL